jgi:hypothetical protein
MNNMTFHSDSTLQDLSSCLSLDDSQSIVSDETDMTLWMRSTSDNSYPNIQEIPNSIIQVQDTVRPFIHVSQAIPRASPDFRAQFNEVPSATLSGYSLPNEALTDIPLDWNIPSASSYAAGFAPAVVSQVSDSNIQAAKSICIFCGEIISTQDCPCISTPRYMGAKPFICRGQCGVETW